MSWKTRKGGKGHQPGTRFRSDKELTLMREYLAEEKFHHDLNNTIEKFTREATRLQSEGQKADMLVQMTQDKLRVMEAIINELEDIKRNGRTQIGDGELRMIVRNIASSLNVSPTIIDL